MFMAYMQQNHRAPLTDAEVNEVYNVVDIDELVSSSPT